jgi:hypothetical protein
MNTGLKNKLLVMATAAGLMGVGCGGSSEPPAAEEGVATEPTTGGEGTGEAAPVEGAAPAEGAAAPAGGEASCSESSCS